MELDLSVPRVIAAVCLTLLALAHSVLGEKEILRPLFQARWEKPGPRWAMERILRFAWHLTSLAWLALAALAIELPLGATLAALGLWSGGVIFVMLRGHLAWPLFVAVGLAGLQLQGWLSPELLAVGVLSSVVALLGAAFLHVYWVAGGRWGLEAAIPKLPDGAKAFSPPPVLTAAVAAALLSLAALMLWTWVGPSPTWARWLLGAGGVVMVLRAIGDGKRVGLSKTERGSLFATWDDRLFTPLVLLLAGGCGAALLA